MPSPRFSGLLRKPDIFIRQVQGDSMLPALKPGHIVIARSRYRALRPGDIVIIRHGGLEKIKRIAELHHDRLFVAGDNQAHSTDSRSFGWRHISAVVGLVMWPRK